MQFVQLAKVTEHAWHSPFTKVNLLLAQRVQVVEEVHATQFRRYVLQLVQAQVELSKKAAGEQPTVQSGVTTPKRSPGLLKVVQPPLLLASTLKVTVWPQVPGRVEIA